MAIVDARGPAGLDRGRRLSPPLRDDAAALARRRDPAGRRPRRPQGRGGLAARRPRRRLGRRCGARAEAFARDVAAGDRRRAERAFRAARRSPLAARGRAGVARRRARSGVSSRPRRDDPTGNGSGALPEAMPRIQPAEPVPPTSRSPGADRRRGADDLNDEPAVPDEARARIVADATADAPIAAGPRGRAPRPFRRCRGARSPGSGMEAVKRLLRDRPGGTQVVLHVPAPGGGRHCRWSCAGAWPTTRSCWPRSVASSATGSWSLRLASA